MLTITLTCHYQDGRTVDVTSGPATQVAFEREFGLSIAKLADEDERKMSHIYWLAWHASKPGVGFDEWLESLAAVDVEVDVPDPTQPPAPAD